mgnify:CR=1 FL=1
MNNVLKIGNGIVELCGFNEIKDVSYFSFRVSDLIISNKKTGLYINEKMYKVINHKIYDTDLADKLKRYCFEEAHSFRKLEDSIYKCKYSFIEDELKNGDLAL